MARARSPNSIEAEEMYKNGMKLVDIAKKLDVPASTVRRWKSTQNWDGKTKGKKNERSQKKKTNARHKGGQPGNRNAVGNKGGPLKPGDKIAENADAGNIPLVTPSSQIVGTQAVFNVISGERYKTVTKEFKDVIAGKYGRTPTPIDPEFRKSILKGEEAIDCRPADLLEPELDTLRKECAEWIEQDEDVLTYAMFPKVAPKFFEKRRNKKYGIDGKNSDAASKIHMV